MLDNQRYNLTIGAAAAAAGGWAWQRHQQQAAAAAALPAAEEGAHLVNWSATHEVCPRRLYQPERQAELEALVALHHKSGECTKHFGVSTLHAVADADGDMVTPCPAAGSKPQRH